MKKEKGLTRFVIVIPELGIVIKFPIIHLINFIVLVVQHGMRSSRWIAWKGFWNLPAEARSGYKGQLFGGLWANWSEFQFYRKTKNPFLLPTYMSVFGLVNVQQIGESCDFENDNPWHELINLTLDICQDPHSFSESGNLCYRDGNLRIFDYAGTATQQIILKHGVRFSKITKKK